MNGKAKIDFEKWLKENYGKFEVCSFQDSASAPIYEVFLNEIDLPKTIENALIIEWLDSVGIGVDAYTSLFDGKLIYGADIIAEFDIQRDSATINLNLNCKTRQEATEKAIETAVNIYNEKQK